MLRLISFAIIFLVIIVHCYGQEVKPKFAIGINLPPLVGKTIDLKLEGICNNNWTMLIGLGAMEDNKLQGTYFKLDDGMSNHSNSGLFATIGIRYNDSRKMAKARLFFGSKLIGGSFNQQATEDETGAVIGRKGNFLAMGFESGVTLKIYKRLGMDIGIQYSPVLFSDKQVSGRFSILPGIGAIGDLQGILAIKYLLNKSFTD